MKHATKPPHPEDPALEPLTVLVVDDEPYQRRSLELQLQSLGCRIQAAGSGKEALDLVEQAPPDLILLDVFMPGATGLEVCQALKANPATREIPVVLLTAMRGEAKEEGFRAGADDFLTKPPSYTELKARIRTHLQLRTLRMSQEASRRDKSAIAWEPGRRLRALVVTGHDRLRDHVAAILRRDGLEADTAGSVREALDKVAAAVPQVLVVDRQLPDGNGLALCWQLRRFPRTAGIQHLMMCEEAELSAQGDAVDVAVDDHLLKPFHPPELRVRVGVLLRKALASGGPVADHVPGSGLLSLMDPQSGAFGRAFLEAHLDQLLALESHGGPAVALLGLRLPEGADLKAAADKVRGALEPQDALCRVGDRTFAVVAPGLAPEGIPARVQALHGRLPAAEAVGVPVKGRDMGRALRKLATALWKAGPGAPSSPWTPPEAGPEAPVELETD